MELNSVGKTKASCPSSFMDTFLSLNVVLRVDGGLTYFSLRGGNFIGGRIIIDFCFSFAVLLFTRSSLLLLFFGISLGTKTLSRLEISSFESFNLFLPILPILPAVPGFRVSKSRLTRGLLGFILNDYYQFSIYNERMCQNINNQNQTFCIMNLTSFTKGFKK